MQKPIRYAFLMVGFNNWGKTTLIYDLFPHTRFYMGVGYSLREDVGRLFTVESASNDDIQGAAYTKKIGERMSKANSNAQDFVGVLCASREPNNNACDLLNDPVFMQFDEIHLFLMRHKWDLHAELRIPEVRAFFEASNNQRLKIHVIDEGTALNDVQRGDERCRQAQSLIKSVLQNSL